MHGVRSCHPTFKHVTLENPTQLAVTIPVPETDLHGLKFAHLLCIFSERVGHCLLLGYSTNRTELWRTQRQQWYPLQVNRKPLTLGRNTVTFGGCGRRGDGPTGPGVRFRHLLLTPPPSRPLVLPASGRAIAVSGSSSSRPARTGPARDPAWPETVPDRPTNRRRVILQRGRP